MAITEIPGSPAAAHDEHRSGEDAPLAPGTRVEVRRRFDAKWARGFEVVDTADDRYRLRRLSDGEELPVSFSSEDVRRERHHNSWWF